MQDLGAIRVLAEKTKDIGEVAYTMAIQGRVEALAALLMVAAERVNGSVLELRTNTGLAVEKTTVYSCVIKEAVSIFVARQGKHGIDSGGAERRKILLREMELLHFFGASPYRGSVEKKATSPLILASQVR